MNRLLSPSAPRRLAAAEDGAAAAEFALIFPVFFVLLFATFEFARACFAFNTLQYVVSQGARYVMTSPAGKPSASNCANSLAAYQTSVQAYVQRQLATVLPSATVPMPIAVPNCAASPPTVTVTVNAAYNFDFILPNLVALLGTISLRQQATVTTPLI